MEFNEIMSHIETAFSKAGYCFGDYDIDVKINNRLSSTLGKCKYTISSNGYCNPYRIEISGKLISKGKEQEIIDVIYHEAAHALVTIETRENHGHDSVFKAMCKRIGTDNDKCKMKVEYNESESPSHKYDVFCKNCGELVAQYDRAGKVIKNIERCTCKGCGGHLYVIQNY